MLRTRYRKQGNTIIKELAFRLNTVRMKLVILHRAALFKNPTLGDHSSHLMTSKGSINRCSRAAFIDDWLAFISARSAFQFIVDTNATVIFITAKLS